MKYIMIICVILSLASCSQEERQNYDPVAYLNESEIEDFKYEIIRYVGKLPGKANHQTKFNEEFDEDYLEQSVNHELLYYYEDKSNGAIYFLVTRVAPSIHYKKVATGGKMKRDSNGKITDYEEAFRTWKMPVDELTEKSYTLFKDYVNQKELSPYYAANSGEEEYIEFPNETVSYNSEERIWFSTLQHPMSSFYEKDSEVGDL